MDENAIVEPTLYVDLDGTYTGSDSLLASCIAFFWGRLAYLSRKFIYDKKWQNLYLICSLIIAFTSTIDPYFTK